MNRLRNLLPLFLLVGLAYGQPDKAPLPRIEPIPPGEVQPPAPGQRPAPPLPSLSLDPPVPEVRRAVWASNGDIEAAWALVLLPEASSPAAVLAKAQQVAQALFKARPGLEEADVTLYEVGEYAGFGGPLPRFTAAVNKARLAAFSGLNLGNLRSFDHLWLNPGDSFYGPPAPPTPELERGLKFAGSSAQVQAQRLEQAAAARQGGVVGGRFFHGDPQRPQAALTFDDAPHPLYTPLLLDTLRRAGVKATFFVVGRNAEAYPYFVRDMAKEGHEIANHTYHHVRLNALSAADIRAEMVGASRVIEPLAGRPLRLFRPPGGRFSPQVLEVARSLGLTTVFWTDDPGDFENLGQSTLETRLLAWLRPGGIVLLHDNVLQTLEVLPEFLNLARQQGLILETAGRLAAGR